MKKLLTVLGAVGLTATASIGVVACSSTKSEPPLTDLSQEELQNKWNAYYDRMFELRKKMQEVAGNPKEFFKLFDQFIQNTFEMYFFRARVFLETKYIFEGFEVIIPNDEETYQFLLKQEIKFQKEMKEKLKIKLSGFPPGLIKDYTSYFKTFENYISQLETKVISDQN